MAALDLATLAATALAGALGNVLVDRIKSWRRRQQTDIEVRVDNKIVTTVHVDPQKADLASQLSEAVRTGLKAATQKPKPVAPG